MQELSVPKTFSIEIGEADGSFFATVKSLQENKACFIQAYNMRLLMLEIGKVVRKRSTHLRRFPIPEPSPIVTLEQDRINVPPRLIYPNGH